MITRKRLTELQRNLLEYKKTAPISIGESRDDRKLREHFEEVLQIQVIHAYIWLTRPVCQLCGGGRRAECMGLEDQMHEDPSRAKTRGLPPDQRFNLLICGRLCAACHEDVTHNRIRIVFDNPALGFLGPVRIDPT